MNPHPSKTSEWFTPQNMLTLGALALAAFGQYSGFAKDRTQEIAALHAENTQIQLSVRTLEVKVEVLERQK